MEEQSIKIKEVSGRKRFIIELNKVSERNNALDIRINNRTPLKWDRYEREWYIEEEEYLPLYKAFIYNTAQKRMSDVGRQTKNVRKYTERIFMDKEAGESFFRAVFRFRNMNLNNIVLAAVFAPDAEIFKTFEEWKKLGLEIERSGISFFDLRPAGIGSAHEENIVNGITAKLEKREYQRLASFLIRKNGSDPKCFDILQLSYEQEEETAAILSEWQSKRELREFITEYVLDQEIDFERTALTFFYPDTSLDIEKPDDARILRTVINKTNLRKKPDYGRLYNMLCRLCRENSVLYPEEGETIEKVIKRILSLLVWELTDSAYKDIVSAMLYVFYGLEQVFPELKCELPESAPESERYKWKRECLKDIKRTFDYIVYNIEGYMDSEIVYIFEPSALQDMSSGEDVRGGHPEKWDDLLTFPEDTEEDDTDSDDDLTPAEKEWIKENKLEEIHNVTLCFWQLREAYKDYRGISYKMFHEIYNEKVRKDRYEKKIELTLRACENLSELKDSFYHQIFRENKEKPLLGKYFMNGGPDPVYIGDLIELYSEQDNIYSLNYIDVKGYTEISKDEFYKNSNPQTMFVKQYEKDRVRALEMHLKVKAQEARIISALPQSVLAIPATEDGLAEYREKGADMAQKISSLLPYAPVLVCNRCVSMLQDDELWIKENDPALYEKLQCTNRVLKRGEVVPFRIFCKTVDAYQDAVETGKKKGYYQGYDRIDFLIFGKVEDEIYIYFSSMITGRKRKFYDYVKDDMNRQYGRLYEEYRQRRKRNGEKITAAGRKAAVKEMGCYVQMAKAVSRAAALTAGANDPPLPCL